MTGQVGGGPSLCETWQGRKQAEGCGTQQVKKQAQDCAIWQGGKLYRGRLHGEVLGGPAEGLYLNA